MARGRECGASVVSVQWGAWICGGMATNDTSTVSRLERTGVGVGRPRLWLAVHGSVTSQPAGVRW